MTIKKALKVWHDSVGFNEIECSRALQESITVAFRSLEAWKKVKEEIKQIRIHRDYLDVQGVTIIEVLEIIDKHLAEVEHDV